MGLSSSVVATSKMKITVDVTGTQLAFIDDLLRRDPVAVVVKVGQHTFDVI